MTADSTPTPRPSTWDAMKRDDKPHPIWWHPWLATAWVGATGPLVDTMDWSTWTHLGTTVGAAALGTVVGSACSDTELEHQRPLTAESSAIGTVTGAAAGIWAWAASAADLATDPLQPGMWGALALGGVAWGAWYASLRLRLTRSRQPGSDTAAKLTTKVLKGEYEQVFFDAGFGNVEVVEIKKGFGDATERAIVALDPTRNDTSPTVINAHAKLAGNMVRIFADRRGIELPDGAVTITKHRSARRVIVDVKLIDIVSESIDPAIGEDITTPVTDPSHPLILGLYLRSGERIEQPESGPHGIAVGSTGSGKSTYYRSQIVQYMRRSHVALMAAGTSKLHSFLTPFLRPAADGTVSRSPFAMLGGGDSGSRREANSALQVVMAAYTLYRVRMSSRDLPRDDGGNIVPSKAHPRVIVYLDEINDLVKQFKEDNVRHEAHELPTGEKVTLPTMLEHLGSKGRSEGIELELGTQRTTDSFLGFNGRDLITNVHRRAVFYTRSAHDVKAVTQGVDPSRIEKHCFYLGLSAQQEQQPAKVIYYDQNSLVTAMRAADTNDTFGDLSGTEAEALGDLWSQRWSRERFGDIAAFHHVEHLITGNGAATTNARPSPSSSAKRSGSLRSARIDAAIARAHAEAAEGTEGAANDAELTADQKSMWDKTMSELENLPTTEAAAASGTPTDATPAQVRQAVLRLIGEAQGVTSADALAGLGWIDANTDTTTYNAAAAALRDALRDATSNAGLSTRQVRVDGGGRDRLWMRADLEGDQ